MNQRFARIASELSSNIAGSYAYGVTINRQVKRHRRSCENVSYSLFQPLAQCVIPEAYQKRIPLKWFDGLTMSGLISIAALRSKPCGSSRPNASSKFKSSLVQRELPRFENSRSVERFTKQS